MDRQKRILISVMLLQKQVKDFYLMNLTQTFHSVYRISFNLSYQNSPYHYLHLTRIVVLPLIKAYDGSYLKEPNNDIKGV